MNSILDSLFLDIGNIFELRNLSRSINESNIFSIDDSYINLENIKKFTSTREYINISNSVDNGNILYILDLVNNRFLDSVKKISNIKKNVERKTLSNYYNPYEGSIDINLTINKSNTNTDFDNRQFLDRKNKNKTVLLKCMNSRLTDKLETDDSSILENNYYFSKRLKLNI